MTTGQRIQQARKATNLSQRALGQKLGVSGSMIAQYENDLRNPKQETLQRMADVLEVDANWLRTGTDSEQQDQLASPSKISEEVFKLLSFLRLPPEQTILVGNNYKLMKNFVEQICSIAEEEEPNVQNIKILAQAFAQITKQTRELIPDGFSEMKAKYEEQQRRDRDYEEFLTKYRRLNVRNRKETEKYMDYLIYCQENK